MVRKIAGFIPPEVLQEDLKNLCRKALELGASQAEIITTDRVIIDERVRAKCLNPKCPTYGTCGNCPPYAPDLDFVRKVNACYRYAIFIQAKFPAAPPANAGSHPLTISGGTKSHEIIAKVEAAAFHDGYYLAMGLGAGSCKPVFCADAPCAVLKGEGCRQGLRSRFSMESWGMDAFLMAAQAGWEVYPGGADGVPFMVTLGLVYVY
jgi:predicted metal-binding protein